MEYLSKTILFTNTDGNAKFREESISLDQGTPASLLSTPFSCKNGQFRKSPIGFSSDFHCTTSPQWCFILQGSMEISLQDGSSRVFTAGEYFYSADLLPQGAVFDTAIHGHRSRQVGTTPLVTLFIKD